MKKEKQYLSQIETPTESYVARYKWANDMAVEQQNVFWFSTELGVEEDEQDFRNGLSEQDQHAVLYAQSILTKYEGLIGGEEFWSYTIPKLFPRPEIQRMAIAFANVELSSHAEFYKLGNEVMGVADDEFYYRWQKDTELKKRIEYVVKASKSKDPLLTTAALAFLEGAVLFSIFGYFKAFNTRGNNLIPHFVSGIDASVVDEDFHSRASAALFMVCLKERTEAGNFSEKQLKSLKSKVKRMAKSVYQHELRLMDQMFAKGESAVVTKEELIDFLQDRINIVLNRLGCEPLFKKKVKPDSISSWFYDQLNKMKIPDFFAASQIAYTRNWSKEKLVFTKDVDDISFLEIKPTPLQIP